MRVIKNTLVWMVHACGHDSEAAVCAASVGTNHLSPSAPPPPPNTSANAFDEQKRSIGFYLLSESVCHRLQVFIFLYMTTNHGRVPQDVPLDSRGLEPQAGNTLYNAASISCFTRITSVQQKKQSSLVAPDLETSVRSSALMEIQFDSRRAC